ncbi:MAG: DUF2971 domain-containing protein [Bacteroidales bacterium]|nr:DUF2971 domain-containing protein [Bacteroidales bacterium]
MTLIYKYRNWESVIQRRFITNNEVYFASPKSLKDPLEVLNTFHYDKLSEDDKLYFISEIISVKEHWRSRESIIDKAKRWLENDKKNGFEALKRHGRRVSINLRKEVGVFSAANSANNNHLWKNYANDYKGFCIGYNFEELVEYISKIGKGSLGGDVDYFDTLPDIIPNLKSRIEDAFLLCKTKLKKWEEEDENRIVKFQFVNKKVSIKSSIIKEIIIGEEISEKSKSELIKHVQRKYIDCKIYKAFRPSSSTEKEAKVIELK